MWPNIMNMFGIGGGGAPAPVQKGAGNPLGFSDNALASGGWEEPTVEEPVTSENLMSGNPEKSAEMQRALKYKRLNWAPDDTIDKSIWDQINPPSQTKLGEATTAPNTPGSTPPPSANVPPPAQTTPATEQKASMFGQFGDPKKAMGSIWDQMKGIGGKVKEGITALDKKLEENYAASGYAPEMPELDKPWTVKDIPRDMWDNYEMGILASPDAKGNEETLMKMAMAGEGDQRQLDPERWKAINQYITDTKDNPYYRLQRNKADALANPGANQIAKGYIQGSFR